MFDFDVVTGPSDAAKQQRSDARRPSAPPVGEAPARRPAVPQPVPPGRAEPS